MGYRRNQKRMVLGNNIQLNDVILGVESSGLHSNGYTLARKILLSRYSLKDQPPYLSKPLGEELLVPTRIYVKPVVEILEKEPPLFLCTVWLTSPEGRLQSFFRLNDRMKYCLSSLPPLLVGYSNKSRS